MANMDKSKVKQIAVPITVAVTGLIMVSFLQACSRPREKLTPSEEKTAQYMASQTLNLIGQIQQGNFVQDGQFTDVVNFNLEKSPDSIYKFEIYHSKDPNFREIVGVSREENLKSYIGILRVTYDQKYRTNISLYNLCESIMPTQRVPTLTTRDIEQADPSKPFCPKNYIAGGVRSDVIWRKEPRAK
jgi:Type IV pilin-like G and H, putative